MNREIFRFEVEPAPAVRERRHSHISGSDRRSPLAVTGGEIESGLWWASLFLRNALAEGRLMEEIDEAHNTVATASRDRKGVFNGSL